MDLTLADAARTVKFWALLAACFTFLIYGGMLNTLLPTILIEEAGMSATQAAQMYSVYNITGVLGKARAACHHCCVPPLHATTAACRRCVWRPLPL